jgi:hypothetical protein
MTSREEISNEKRSLFWIGKHGSAHRTESKATPYNKRKELRRTAAITNSAGMLWFLIAQAH